MCLWEEISTPFVAEQLLAKAVWGCAPTDFTARGLPSSARRSAPPEKV